MNNNGSEARGSATGTVNEKPKITIGFIGTGRIAKALADKSVKAGYSVVLSNSRGPGSLTDYVHGLGSLASEGTVVEAARADVVVLAVAWSNVAGALRGITEWKGKIVVDATNPILADGTLVDLGESTSSEVIAAQLPGPGW
jgi:predicted dinucleotide-binding enzyme